MKKFTFLFFVIVYSFSAHAQQHFGTDLGIGLKGGFNYNKIVGDGIAETYKTSPHVGAFVFYNKKRYGIQIESVWTQNGFTTDSSFYGLYKQYFNNINDSTRVGSFRFSNISIPILFNWKFSKKIWFQFGPQYNGLVSMVDKNHILKSGVEIIKKNNVNLVSGIWLQLGGDAPLIKVNVGARLIYGINNLNILSNYEVWRNQMIQLHIGFTY